MTSNTNDVVISPFETEKDFKQAQHCVSEAFGRQAKDSIWMLMNPGWDTEEGQAKHAKGLMEKWQSVTTNKDGQPNAIYLKATLPDPNEPGERRVVGMAIWRQLSFVEGYGDPFSDDVSASLTNFDETKRRFATQMLRSLWKRRIAYMHEVKESGRNPPAIFTLDICAVDPAYQRRGIASKLVEVGLAEAKKRGDLECTTEGSAMGRAVYQRLGFKDEGTGDIQYEVDEDANMPIVDIHTHVYPPKYMELLRSRSTVPYVRTFPDAPDSARLIILPGEDDPSMPSTSRGRPIGQEYYEIKEKIAFMDLHKIDKSVISLANPWLDFLPAEEAGEAAKKINDDVNDQCSQYPGRLYFFGTLPLSASPEVITAEIERLSTLKYARGVIMGTSGLGQGLDDAKLDPVYAALEKHQQLIFLHPHYGLPASVYGPRASEYGHVLPLALGFPLETTIAVSRMLLSGVWDRFTKLSVLLAHSGGTLPFLAGRIESCILHDGHLKKHGKTQNRRDVWDILKTNIYLDAVIYSEVGLKAALDASGSDRLLFGTDHPFFPPLEEDAKEWHSVNANYGAISKAFATDDKKAQDVLGGNAVRILRLD
ncbi:hypothetical protein COCC4DRAFT_126737 [Bipolaris maydis ATCC 48331]|uniref:N-acetyltransferase domain-containing protein n=2 Tax=Cochliobolus heterostrophus TaxID=5016 RepID=M2SZA1_COCH5|nr:uncharacterized protein COCC4DRAFT_126737 [Bipolaris maydis ATCC 48331]EMD90710.1 hypothetical protein COCHEDRAFT_1195858 [Bipolaris maydis C5]KAJ5023499.1 hypothetical protein J3E73DRAFT_399385 [Bipolaris maydis]ENI09079.1 hypothetical protein COCC4DRAFT_126737 [Bipolaris maydis ATCC 48331]KAJ6206595.1 hypothetical protein PSV09DRAFT_1195858 [Bipolaris maydis]KAJ6269293.1 hypothetical protein PSV08DRAFT_206420 [Bipolaris maydis]